MYKLNKRIIKFRGKKIASKEWVYGGLVQTENLDPAIYFECGKGTVKNINWCYVDKNTIGQYAGTDKNGTEVYDGDIIKETDTGNILLVFWSEFEFGFRFAQNDFGYVFPNHLENFEVIGNIYDNEELVDEIKRERKVCLDEGKTSKTVNLEDNYGTINL